MGHHVQGYPARGRAADQHRNLLQRGGGLHRPGPDRRGQDPRQLRDGDVPELHLRPRLPHAQAPDVSRGGSGQGETRHQTLAAPTGAQGMIMSVCTAQVQSSKDLL